MTGGRSRRRQTSHFFGFSNRIKRRERRKFRGRYRSLWPSFASVKLRRHVMHQVWKAGANLGCDVDQQLLSVRGCWRAGVVQW